MSFRDLRSVEASTSNLPLLGYTVLWRLAGIRVSQPNLEQALQGAGFSKYLPSPPTPRVALHRALTEWIRVKREAMNNSAPEPEDEETEESNPRQRRTLIRVINRARSEHVVYALIAEDIDFSALGLSYGTSLRILLHKKTGEMICTTEARGEINAQRESQQVTKELMPYWEQYRKLFIARDLSEMMRKIIEGMSAVSLRRTGGIYFVPADNRDPLLRLQELISGIPQITEGAYVCALGVPDALETRRTLSKAVHAGLLDEIESLRGDLARLSESDAQHREKTITERLLLYRKVKKKAEMYRDALGIRQDQLMAGIRELETQAQNLLSGEDAPPSTPHETIARHQRVTAQPA